MDVFEQYEESFVAETQQVTNQLSKFNYDKTPHEKRSALASAKNSLRKADGLLKQMKAHSRDMEPGTRSQMRSKLSQYDKTMQSLRADIDRAESAGERDMVLGMGGMSAEARSQHMRMADATSRMRDQNATVRGAVQQAMDTEDVALGITEQLHANRETIMSARRKAKETASLTDQARYIVRNMSRREARRKLSIICLGIFLLGIVIIVIVVISQPKQPDKSGDGGTTTSGDSPASGGGDTGGAGSSASVDGGGGRRRLLMDALHLTSTLHRQLLKP